MTLVSLPVEYEIDGTKQSTLFFIYKNADGSIVWLTDKPKTQPQDLAAMHRQIALLDTARKDLPASGVVYFLAEESAFLAKELRDILAANRKDDHKIDMWNKPMRRALIEFDEAEENVLPWQRKSIILFASRYRKLVDRCEIRGLPSPPSIPNQMDAEAFLSQMDAHAEELKQRARSIATPFGPPTQQPSAQLG